MSTPPLRRPRLTLHQARDLLRREYGLEGTAEELPGERDRNFRIETAAGEGYVLKVAGTADPGSDHRTAGLEAQQALLEHLAERDPTLGTPRPVRAASGARVVGFELGGAPLLARLVTWVEGVPLARVRPRSPELLASVGALLGRLDRALEGALEGAPEGAPLAAGPGDFPWDLARAPATVGQAPELEGRRRARVLGLLAPFAEGVAPALGGLRAGAIHNDANDHNVLVSPLVAGPLAARERRATGLIDFGDVLSGPLVFDVAVGAAYGLLGQADPLAAAAALVGGYHRALPLEEEELALLFPAILARLCLSVVMSARQRAREPENAYLSISEAPAWEALERLEPVHLDHAHLAFRAACGLEPCGASPRVVTWLERHPERLGPLLQEPIGDGPRLVLDLSPAGSQDPPPGNLEEVRAWSEGLRRRLAASDATLAVGRYAEPRLAYAGEQFAGPGERRTVHLGLDLFAAAGTPILAPLDGRVHSFADNARVNDYGPTILLEHEPEPGLRFMTLYGHLTRDSLAGLAVGAPIRRGQVLARIGDTAVNGGWPPHLHLQIVIDPLGREGDFPGVAPPSELALWTSLCPDPNLIARLEGLRPARPATAPEERVAARGEHLSSSLSVSYARPLALVRGWRQQLYDEQGQPYLDAVNNVPHVGHAHPRVVEAAARQMALLNTNTRYLHRAILDYSERLCVTLPEPLEVCFLVCSGSEANELAIRLARAHTGRRDAIVLDGAYHGNTTTLVDLSPYKHAGPGGQGPPAWVHVAPTPDVYRSRLGDDPRAGVNLAAGVGDLARRLVREGRAPAFFLCESLLGCAGQIVPPPGYLAEAFRHVRAAGGVCIADEVQVGLGRVGRAFWGFELAGVVPDVVTVGKPIGNGHPLAAVITTRAIAASFEGGMEYFNTFGGNSVSCAVGMAVLDVIEAEGLQANALRVGDRMKQGLAELASRHPIVGDVRGVGLFLGVELVQDRGTLEPAAVQAAYVIERMRDRGILLSTDGPRRNVLKIKPPLVFTEADARRLVATLDQVLEEDGARPGPV